MVCGTRWLWLVVLGTVLAGCDNPFDHRSKNFQAGAYDDAVQSRPIPQDLIDRNLLGVIDYTTWQLYDMKIAANAVTMVNTTVPCVDGGDAVVTGSRVLQDGNDNLELRMELLNCRFSWINRAWAVNVKLTGLAYVTAFVGADGGSDDRIEWLVSSTALTATGMIDALTTLPDTFVSTAVTRTAADVRLDRIVDGAGEGTFSGKIDGNEYRWIIGRDPALVVTDTTSWCTEDEASAAAYCCASLADSDPDDGTTGVAEFCRCPDNTLNLGVDLQFNIDVCQCVLCDQ